jgi:hypothetical protein
MEQKYIEHCLSIKNTNFHLHINNNFTKGPMHMMPETLVIVKWTSNINRLLEGL